MLVIAILPSGKIYDLGKLSGQILVTNDGEPARGREPTRYSLTISKVNAWVDRRIAPGDTDTYHTDTPNNVYIKNDGPDPLRLSASKQG